MKTIKAKIKKTKANHLKLTLVSSVLLLSSFTAPAQEDRDRDIVVAIIDTGADVTHPLIQNNIWTNTKEVLNGIDDDGNGLIDDIHGWNFVNNNNDLKDNNGHGTHIAGIIQLRSDSSRVKYMILKYFNTGAADEDTVSATAKAIRYATEMNVDIINYSGGGYSPNDEEKKAIKEANKKGILFVAAAGNDGIDTSELGYFPASYKINNIISVAAMDAQKQLLASSNYGSDSVDLMAPGKKIFSSLPGGLYGYMSGTSQATAWVTGLSAKLMVRHKFTHPEELKSQLLAQGTIDKATANKLRSQVRISKLQFVR